MALRGGASMEFVPGQVFLVGGDEPAMTEGIRDAADAGSPAASLFGIDLRERNFVRVRAA